MIAPGSVHDLLARDGTALRFRTWEAESPRAAVLVVHGLGEHSGRYDELATALREHEISVHAVDLRGHGLSGGPRGHVPSFSDFLADLELASAEVRARAPDQPLFLLGHSMGGLVALRFVQTRNVEGLAGLVLSAPQLRLADPPPAWLRLLSRVVGAVLPALPFPNGIDAGDLSHDPVEVEAYRADPLVHDRITPRLFQEMEKAMQDAADEIAAVDVPAALVLIPGADPVVEPEATRALAARLTRTVPTEVLEYPSMYHEPLHEVERTRVIADLLAWLLPRIR